MYHFALRIRNMLFGMLYLTALAVAVILVYETLQLASKRPDWPVIIIGAEERPTATPKPTATVAPAVLKEVVPLKTFPTATSVVPIPTVSTPIPRTTGHHPKSGRHIVAWLPPSLSGGARASFDANKDILDEISPFWYSTNANGQLYGNRNDELVVLAHENNILVLPSIHNIGNYEIIVNIISDPQQRSRHVQNIIDEVLARNYDGIDIDYESLDASVRPAYSAFIKELGEALHVHGKILSVAVHAKDRDYGGLGGFQDWTVIGQYADRVRIMTYDYHWRGGGPGPVAPLYWVQAVAEYAATVIDPSKVFIGVPFYGYDWPPQGNARGLPWGDIEDLIEEQDLTVNLMQRNRDGPVDESWFRYQSERGMREVWFMTDRGLESKLELVQTMDLAGIAIWQLGYEKPEYWDVIRKKLVQDPVLIQRSINPLLPEH
jgi:spore germination protein